MQDGLKKIIGKTIASVVVAANKREPRHQVFLIFSDGTSFEFFGQEFSCASNIDNCGLDGVKHYINNMHPTITDVY